MFASFFSRPWDQMGQKCPYLAKNASYGLQLYHLDHPQRNFRFRAMGHFLGSPLFLVVSGLCHFTIKRTLNFGRFSTKLGGTQNDNGPGPGRFYRETAAFTRNFLRDWYWFWKRVLFPVVARTWLVPRSVTAILVNSLLKPSERRFISYIGDKFSTFRFELLPLL